MASLRILASVIVLALAACRPATSESQPTPPPDGASTSGEAKQSGESKRPEARPKPTTTSAACPLPPLLGDPGARVDLPLDEHAFARCDFPPGTVIDRATYEAEVECADPPGRPALDFAEVRLVAVRLEEPSTLLGATREPGSAITRVHLIKHSYCGGVDPGNRVHVAVVPADGSEIEIDVCYEPSGCTGEPAP